MYWTVCVTMMPQSLFPFESVFLHQCHADHQMRQLKDRLRDELNVSVGEKVELYIWDGSGGVINIGDDDSVEQVVQAIVQVHIPSNFKAHRVGRVEIPPI